MSDNLIKTLKSDEGLSLTAHRARTQGGGRETNLTLGYGYNLHANRERARAELLEAGVAEEDLSDVIAGRKGITEGQAEELLKLSAGRAVDDARAVISNYDTLPPRVQDVVANMAFQLGRDGLRGFSNMREALYTGDYNRAAEEILNSDKARRDSTNRANRHANVLREVAKDGKKKNKKGKEEVSGTEQTASDRLSAYRKELLFTRAAQRYDGDPRVDRLSKLVANMPIVARKEEEVVTEDE